VIAVVGAVLARSNDWSAGAVLGILVVAIVVATVGFAVPAARRAPQISAAHIVHVGGAVAQNPRLPGELSPDRVLVLAGPRRTGKTALAQEIVAAHPDWGRASCGEYVKACARAEGVEGGRSATDVFGQELVERLGGHAFLDGVLEYAQIPPESNVLVIDDVYHLEVYEAIEARWSHLKFASLTLPPSIQRSLAEQERSDLHPIDPLDRSVDELESRRRPDRQIVAGPDDHEWALQELGGLVATA
jgi:hypothetical protein